MILNNVMSYDKIILGAGMFGLYAALISVKKGERVLVLEHDDVIFKRASWINQARVHNGYHYPRSYSTAKKTADYFDRFVKDYDFAILTEFKKIYAISNRFSYTNAKQFAKFCEAVDIHCDQIHPGRYFKNNTCDGVFETLEYSFDAKIIGDHLLRQLLSYANFAIRYESRLEKVEQLDGLYQITTNHGIYTTSFVVNATYASLNQIMLRFGLEPFKIKYELCEIVLCKVSDNIKNVGLTLMDGPFFSLMPFGKTGYHSLTAVGSTPHLTSRTTLPDFKCQNRCIDCDKQQLGNCNDCLAKPHTAFMSMYKLAKNYFNDDIDIFYHQSLYSMKAILLSSEIDDSRPTIIKLSNDNPKFLSVFSGKINTIYDLEEAL